MSPVGTAQNESVSVKPLSQLTTVVAPQGAPDELMMMLSNPQLSQHAPDEFVCIQRNAVLVVAAPTGIGITKEFQVVYAVCPVPTTPADVPGLVGKTYPPGE